MTHGNLELQFLRSQLLKLRQEIALRPIGAIAKPSNPRQIIQIIGGQLLSALPVIQYSADPLAALTALYDPNVDTTYPTGLGNAWLMDGNGNQGTKVIVRHNFGQTDPLVGGWTYQVGYTTTLTVASGPNAGKTMIAYTVSWSAY